MQISHLTFILPGWGSIVFRSSFDSMPLLTHNEVLMNSTDIRAMFANSTKSWTSCFFGPAIAVPHRHRSPLPPMALVSAARPWDRGKVGEKQSPAVRGAFFTSTSLTRYFHVSCLSTSETARTGSRTGMKWHAWTNLVEICSLNVKGSQPTAINIAYYILSYQAMKRRSCRTLRLVKLQLRHFQFGLRCWACVRLSLGSSERGVEECAMYNLYLCSCSYNVHISYHLIIFSQHFVSISSEHIHLKTGAFPYQEDAQWRIDSLPCHWMPNHQPWPWQCPEWFWLHQGPLPWLWPLCLWTVSATLQFDPVWLPITTPLGDSQTIPERFTTGPLHQVNCWNGW